DLLLTAQEAVTATRGGLLRKGAMLPFQPVVDGVVLDRQPLDAVADGSAAGVALLTGTTAEEFTLFTALSGRDPLDDAGLRKAVGHLVDEERVDEVLEVYRAEHPGASPDALATAVATDYVFRAPAERLLQAQHPHGDTWSYRFTYRTPAFGGVLGACHALDVPFTFDVVEHPGSTMFVGDANDEALALAAGMRSAWAGFARIGEPAGEGLPTWPAWDPERRATMDLGPKPEVVDDPLPRTRQVWT
nr:carboxylesterase family protein [Actinomycetota bacterium]